MIVVRHLTGPRAGTVDRLDPKLDRVVFGRRIDCDVLYPPEETIIAREHFALVRKPPGPAGHWTIELFGEPFVAVNGVPADPGERLPDGARFELGKRGGPSFTVHIETEAGGDNLPLTQPQEQVKGARVVAAYARRMALAGLAAAILAGAAAGYFYGIAPSLKRAEQTAIRAKLLRAAFHVETPEGYATAFPIGPHALATNSHVGEMFEEMKPGERMIVRRPGPNGRTYQVIAAELHPGYKAFDAFVHKDVLRERLFQLGGMRGVPGYDVAILRVKETLPQNTVLPLATQSDLRALKPGSELATAGYPGEGVVGSSSESVRATPEYHTGTVTSVTDFFYLPTDFAHSQLIHDSVPAAGGASGSPIVDQDGRVVAILNAGNNYAPRAPSGSHLPRIASGVLINYAQRIDLLQHLVAGDADQEVTADRKYWRIQFAAFSTGIQIVDNFVLGELRDAKKSHSIEMVRVSEKTGAFPETTRVRTAAGALQRQAEFSVPVSAGMEYVFIAYAHDGSDLQLWFYDGSRLLGHVPTLGKTFLPHTSYKPPADAKLSVWLVHPADRDTAYTFQVFRVQTKTALEQTKAKAAAG